MSYKDIATIKVTLKNEFVYRINAVIKICYSFIPLICTLFLWKFIFSSNSFIGGYNKEQMYEYYIISFLIINTLDVGINEFAYANEIKNGGIGKYIVRPYKVNRYIFFSSFKSLFLFWGVGIIPVILWCVMHVVNFNIDLRVFLILCISMIGAYIINFNLKMIVIALAFYMNSISCLPKAFNTIKQLVGGGIIPIDLFPPTLFNILSFTPFKYLGYFQTTLILNKLDAKSIIIGLSIEVIWVILLECCKKVVWNKGIKRIVSFGG